MKYRLLSFLLTIVMIAGMIPATSTVASAASPIYVGGVEMKSGDYLAVGATETTTTEPADNYAFYINGSLLLHNYSYQGTGYQYYSGKDNAQNALVYSTDDLVVILSGENTLENTSHHYMTGVRSQANLTVKGAGTLAINVKNGISTTGNLVVDSGNLILTDVDYSGMKSDEKDIIINGGYIFAEVRYTAICASKGNVIVNGGSVVAKSLLLTPEHDEVASAIRVGESVTINSSLDVMASTEPDGNLGEYIASNNDDYDSIGIFQRKAPISITIDPTILEVEKGNKLLFAAVVDHWEGISRSVVWSLSGGTASSINGVGLLSVGADETAETLTVTVTLEEDSTKTASATVIVKDADLDTETDSDLNTDTEVETDTDVSFDTDSDGTDLLLGDVTGDGKIQMDDVVEIQKAVAELTKLNADQKFAADVNKDDKVTMDDVVTIQRYIAKLITSFLSKC